MADQPNIFETNQPTQAPTNAPSPANNGAAPNNPNDYAHLLSMIRNERGEQKYATLQDALVGLQHAQSFIPTLKAEQAQKDAEIQRLREEAERAKELERTLAALTSQPTPAPTSAPVLDESHIADLVNRSLTERETKALAQANIQTVVSALQQSFGADADQKFYGKAEEMGLSREEMNLLAAKSPKAVLTMFGVNSAANNKPNNSSPTPGTVNTAAFTPHVETFVGRNPKGALIGATSSDLAAANERANKMVEELHSKGMTVHDLTDPKVFAKYFNQ